MTLHLSEPATIDGFGPQGGDPARGVRIDLSTCVNRYGPPPAVIDALHAIRGDEIMYHPYDAPERLKDLYHWATGVDTEQLVTGRGGTEFIWALARNVNPSTVAVPLPGYTDYLKAFPGRGYTMSGEQLPSLAQVASAMQRAALVIISNPHNPTGELLPAEGLVEIARTRPNSVLVVDESYINFTADPISGSVIGSDVDNIIVLRSTSKFYGIAACRAGVAWCRDPQRLRRVIGRQETWGLSGIDVTVAEAAVRSWDWADDTRARMHADNAWLAEAMRELPGVGLYANTNVHFQYALCRNAEAVADALAEHGIGVRPLGAAHGVRPGGLRIVAPRPEERETVANALASVAASVR
jgi:histidinol-phosphate/aromatic aminotransferase/cobyric acid decarboxylase-like protein